jgi:FAD/FMN-containing dehydrogenase
MIAPRSIPLSALELSAAMRDARPYDASRLDRVLRVDERHGLIEVQAMTSWKAIAACLRPGDERAAAIQTTMPTVGESLACNAAGPDGRPAVTHVESVVLIMPSGELHRVSRSGHRELFALVAGGQGLFGALYSVTLHIGSLAAAVNEAAEAEILSSPPAGSASRALRLLLPPEELASFLAEAQERCREWRMPLAGIKLRRTREENDTFLRWAQREYAALTLSLAEPPVLGVAVRAAQLRRALLDAAIRRGGSFPVHCTPEATREQTEACYPQLPRFLAEKRRIDPGERIVNPWYRHYRRLFSSQRCDVRWAH